MRERYDGGMTTLPVSLDELVQQVRSHDPALALDVEDALQRLLRAASSLAWARDHAPALAAASGPQGVLQAVVDAARALTDAPQVWALGFSQGDRPTLTALAGSQPHLGDTPLAPEHLSRSLVAEVTSEGRPAWSDDAASDARYGASRSIAALSLRSVGCLPLGKQAVLYLADPDTPGRFSADQRSQLSALCSLAGAFLGPPPQAPPAEPLPGIVGDSTAMQELAGLVRAFAPLPWPLLVRGETGTGKELVARAVHALGPTAGGPFVPVNCGAIPEALAESTLFGHVRGAFTGADRDRDGWVGEAQGGTLFLDEIGELSPPNQVRLLRLLQEGTYQRVGEARTRRFEGRIVAATHRPIEDAGQAFRADLYHRLSATVVQVPPLRDRLDDVPLLARHLLAQAARELNVDAPTLTTEADRALCSRSWPGNVRELVNTLRRALARSVAMQRAVLDPAHLAGPVDASESHARSADELAGLDLAAATEHFQRRVVEAALRDAGGNKSEAARQLGVSRQWLHRLVARWGLP